MRRYFSSILAGSVGGAMLVLLIICPFCPVLSALELTLLDWGLRGRPLGDPGAVALVTLLPPARKPPNRLPHCSCPEGQPLRSDYEKVLRELAQQKKSVVVLDVMFHKHCRAHDSRLAKTIRELRKEGMTLITSAYATPSEPPVLPPSPLREAFGEGWIGSPWIYSSEYSDPVHSVELVQRLETGDWYPLSLLAAQAALFPGQPVRLTPTGCRASFGPAGREILIPIRRGDRLSLGDFLRCGGDSHRWPILMPINWCGPQKTFPRFDSRSLGQLSGEDQARLRQARVVFVGSLQENWKTPLGNMPGMGIQASATYTLLTQRFLRPVPTPILLLLMFLVALSTTWMVRRRGGRRGLLFAVGLTALLLLLFHRLLRADLWLYVTLPLFAVGLSFSLALLREQRTMDLLLPPRLRGRELITEEGTALVTDVRGSLGIGVRLGSEEKFRALNTYFHQAEGIVVRYGGELVDYAGDASVYWFPRTGPEDSTHVKRALGAAEKLLETIEHFQQEGPEESRQWFDFGIGIDTGEATIGLAGGSRRKQPTIIGTCVDIAARLEHLTQEYHCRLLVSENSYRQSPDQLTAESLGEHSLKGLPASLKVYRAHLTSE